MARPHIPKPFDDEDITARVCHLVGQVGGHRLEDRAPLTAYPAEADEGRSVFPRQDDLLREFNA
jgi:hypothetical protein